MSTAPSSTSASSQPHRYAQPRSYADITTFRVGGPIASLTTATTRTELIDFARAHQLSADLLEAKTQVAANTAETNSADNSSVLFVSGGSNLLVADAGFAGHTCLVRTGGVEHDANGRVTAQAGVNWDEFVAQCVAAGLSGLEALSGIPGTVGATPIQNVGAYGAEVADTIEHITVFDRVAGAERVFNRADLQFSYRHSVLKNSAARLGQTRYVVLDVTFQLEAGGASAPVRYAQLAQALGVELGANVPVAQVRQTVLELRASKGMVLDANDHDTWSAGSFFTNPILPARPGAKDPRVPAGAPVYPVRKASGAVDEAVVKTSAAWLIDNAGFHKGFGLNERASLSTKHTLALTNRGNARAADIAELAAHIQAGVRRAFGIELHPEPNVVGMAW